MEKSPETQTSTSDQVPKEPPKKLKRRQFKIIAAILMVLVTLIGAANIAMNQRGVQHKLADFLDARTGTRVDFDDIKIQLFIGSISGENISLNFRRNKLFLSLKHFKIHFNPLFFLIGRIKINAVIAQEIFLDTSTLIKREKKRELQKLPDFLKHLRFKRAEIDKFYWNQGESGYLFVDAVRLSSKFGSLFYKSPATMEVRNVKYIGPKVHVFVDELMQDGFFIFDLSQPRIFDESRIVSKVQVNNVLMAIQKRRKPWLTTPGWDSDLTPVLMGYYGDIIPDDKSYLFIDEAGMDFEKNKTSFVLNAIQTRVEDAAIMGSGNYNRTTGIVSFKLSTENPLPFSKLPLGQSQVRQAFEKFALTLKAQGTAQSLDKNHLKIGLEGHLYGNKNNPDVGDATITINGDIRDSRFSTDKISILMGAGTVAGKGFADLRTADTDIAFTCDKFDVKTVIRIFSTVNIPSIADCNGTLRGKLNDPKLRVTIESTDATYEFLHFGPAKADLALENKNLELNVLSNSGEVGQSTLKLKIQNVFDSFVQTLQLNSRHEGVEIQKLLKAKSLRGKVSGTFDMDRKDTVVSARGDFTAKDFFFFDKKIGTITTKLALKAKHLNLSPITIELADPDVTLLSPKGLDFDFDETGYRFTGKLLPELGLSGRFNKTDKDHLGIELKAENLPLKIFATLLPFEPRQSSLTGDFQVKYHVYEPILSEMRGQVKKLHVEIPEGRITLTRPAALDYSGKAFQFKSFEIAMGDGHVSLNGALGLAANSNLKMQGLLDFNVISDFNPFIAESERPIDVDLTFKDDIFAPKIYGKIPLKADTVLFRNLIADFEDIEGTLVFDGNRISVQKISFVYDDAPMQASGYVVTDYKNITGAELSLSGSEVPVHLANGLNFLADVDLRLKGSGILTAAGKINIVEGQYNQDFGLTNFILKPRVSDLEEEGTRPLSILPENTQLNLDIKNTGDFIIKNNLAELEMQADLEMGGTLVNPSLEGQIDFVSGEINAFGIDFQDATGYAQFSRGYGLNPEVSLVAKKEIQEYEIQARVQGHLENLRLRLDSTPSLDRREILSILFYGQTPDQLIGDKRRQFTQTAAISQLASVLSKPINKISGLDVIEVSSRQESANQTIQRLSVGKSLSNRFNLLFTTDLGIEDPERAFELEYQIFDHFYFITAKDIGERDRYRFDISFRLQSY